MSDQPSDKPSKGKDAAEPAKQKLADVAILTKGVRLKGFFFCPPQNVKAVNLDIADRLEKAGEVKITNIYDAP